MERVPGVAAVATAKIHRLEIFGPKNRKVMINVAAIDPLDFRNVAPPAMRDADFVWTSLIAGDGIATHAAAKRLDLDGTRPVRFVAGTRLRVAALVDPGKPTLADVIVSTEWLNVSARKATRLAVVGAESGVTIETLGEALEQQVSPGHLERVLPAARTIAPRPEVLPTVVAPVITGLHPTLSEAVNRLIAATDGQVWLVSGHRTTDHQEQLWLSALQRYGSPEAARRWVAPPGHSMHERGLAVDLGGDLALAARAVQEMRLPLWRPMTWEPWHFELAGSRG